MCAGLPDTRRWMRLGDERWGCLTSEMDEAGRCAGVARHQRWMRLGDVAEITSAQTVNEIRGVCELGRDEHGGLEIADGSDLEFLKILSKALNFTYELFQPEDKQWGVKLEDGNWTGLIGKVHRNETDMSMCAITMTEPRRTAVQFSFPYEIQSLVFATRKPGYLPKVLSFVYPFAPEVWFTILALMVLMPLVWKMLLSSVHSMRRLFFDAFASFLSGSISIRALSFRDFVLVTTWLFGTTFVSLSYTTVLLSFLTLPLQENIVNTIPELARAVKGGSWKVMGFKGTILLNALTTSPIKDVSLLGWAIENNAWYVLAEEESVVNNVQQSKAAVIAMTSFFETFEDSIALAKDSFFPLNLGLVIGEHFCCKESLDLKLLKITAAGLYEKCKRDFQFRARLKTLAAKGSTSVTHVKALSLEDLSGAFIMLCFGYGVSLSAFIVEICVSKYICKVSSTKLDI
ncbi:hypothetical protein JTE90_002151 [Oedothorax gibbosus]|uniref:Ionotropic glutamate receptor L-glutamate and glycine-binding domain-containing protein n=1 Tax=Oedothorax gibbosus TaxID=931172 RepID=A0AAV6V9M4_9ARAC|nr:hypothetical protein JTE90_002151 [Oedothorax gibbosus]